MMDLIEDAVVVLLVAGGSLAALMLFVVGVWVALSDDLFGLKRLFEVD